jgi:hypothetical protein
MPSTSRFREWIALGVLITSIVIIGAVAIVAILEATDKSDTTRFVFTSALPVLGTWVGTILAFYFARDNLQAATESTLRLTSGLAPTTPVTAVMIGVNQINPKVTAADDAAAKALKLKDLYKSMQDAGQSRIPILDSSGAALYVVHEPDIDKYAQSVPAKAAALADTETLDKLLADADLKKAVTAFTAVPSTASVGEAREQLRSNPDVKDVFVTAGGKATDQVLGWLTNSDLARVS